METLTWDTLLDYMQRLTDSMHGFRRKLAADHEQMRKVCSEEEVRETLAYPRRIAFASIWLVPLVKEAQCRPALQSLTPMLSVGIVRLFHERVVFAHITALDEGVFCLQRAQEFGLRWDTHLVCESTPVEVLDTAEQMLAAIKQA